MTGVQTCALPIFEDCKVYYCTHENIHDSDWTVYLWMPYEQKPDGKFALTTRMRHPEDSVVVAILQRGERTSIGRRPIQINYRSDHKPYIKQLIHFTRDGRKVAGTPVKEWPGYWHVGKL